jgi:hypothetical protein
MNMAPQWVISTVFSDALLAADVLNLPALRRDVMRAVATAKIGEFENQAYRLGQIITTGVLGRADAADLLLSISESNGLVHEHGDTVIQSIIAAGLEAR